MSTDDRPQGRVLSRRDALAAARRRRLLAPARARGRPRPGDAARRRGVRGAARAERRPLLRGGGPEPVGSENGSVGRVGEAGTPLALTRSSAASPRELRAAAGRARGSLALRPPGRTRTSAAPRARSSCAAISSPMVTGARSSPRRTPAAIRARPCTSTSSCARRGSSGRASPSPRSSTSTMRSPIRCSRRRPTAGARGTRNDSDGLFRRGGRQLTLALTPRAGGYAGTFTVALDGA